MACHVRRETLRVDDSPDMASHVPTKRRRWRRRSQLNDCLHKSLEEIGKSAKEIPISSADLCISAREIPISFADLLISSRDLLISLKESPNSLKETGNAPAKLALHRGDVARPKRP